MGSVGTSTTAVTVRTAGLREMPLVGAGTAEDFPSGAGAIIAVEAGGARNSPADTGTTAV